MVYTSPLILLLLVTVVTSLDVSEEESPNGEEAAAWAYGDHWPLAVVPYQLHESVGCPGSQQCRHLTEAMRVLEAATCVRFRPWSVQKISLVFAIGSDDTGPECALPPVRALHALMAEPEIVRHRPLMTHLGAECLLPGRLLYMLARTVAPLPTPSGTEGAVPLSNKYAAFINDFYHCKTKGEKGKCSSPHEDGTCENQLGDDEPEDRLTLVVKELSSPEPLVATSPLMPGSGRPGGSTCLQLGWAAYGASPFNLTVWRVAMPGSEPEAETEAEEEKGRRKQVLWTSGPRRSLPPGPPKPQHLTHTFIDVPDYTPFQVRLEMAIDWGVLALEEFAVMNGGQCGPVADPPPAEGLRERHEHSE